MVSTPLHFDQTAFAPRPAPSLGGDSEDVLASLGYDEASILDLKVAGVVF